MHWSGPHRARILSRSVTSPVGIGAIPRASTVFRTLTPISLLMNIMFRSWICNSLMLLPMSLAKFSSSELVMCAGLLQHLCQRYLGSGVSTTTLKFFTVLKSGCSVRKCSQQKEMVAYYIRYSVNTSLERSGQKMISKLGPQEGSLK